MSSKFTDHETVIDADWCNTVDQTVFTALEEAETPSEVREVIGAIADAPDDSAPYVRINEGWELLADHAMTFGRPIVYVGELEQQDETYFIDISDTNPIVLRINAAGTLHQIRGGTEGQLLIIQSTNLDLSLVHHTGAATDEVFQLAGKKDWITPHYRATIALVRCYHSPVGWHWAQVGGNALVKTKHIPAADWLPSTTNGCSAVQQIETSTNKNNLLVRDFDAVTSESAFYQWLLPEDYDGGTITFQVVFTTTDADSGTAIWSLQGRAIADESALDAALSSAVSVSYEKNEDTSTVLLSDVSNPITLPGSPDPQNICLLKLSRDIADTLEVDARLIGVNIFYRSLV